jgi:uncharacterized iron-regulated protein
MIEQAFPGLMGDVVSAVPSMQDVEKLTPTDVCIATYWTTAYYELLFNQTRRKFYSVQDYEPIFYPAGTASAQILRANIARNALNEIQTHYSDWTSEMAKIYRFLCAPKPWTD